MGQIGLFQADHPEVDMLAELKRLWEAASCEVRAAFNKWRRRELLDRACERQRQKADAKR